MSQLAWIVDWGLHGSRLYLSSWRRACIMASGSMVCQATVVVVGSDNGTGVLLLTVSIVANELSFSRMVIVASSESLSSLYCNELPLDNYPTLARPLGSLRRYWREKTTYFESKTGSHLQFPTVYYEVNSALAWRPLRAYLCSSGLVTSMQHPSLPRHSVGCSSCTQVARPLSVLGVRYRSKLTILSTIMISIVV